MFTFHSGKEHAPKRLGLASIVKYENDQLTVKTVQNQELAFPYDYEKYLDLVQKHSPNVIIYYQLKDHQGQHPHCLALYPVNLTVAEYNQLYSALSIIMGGMEV